MREEPGCAIFFLVLIAVMFGTLAWALAGTPGHMGRTERIERLEQQVEQLQAEVRAIKAER